MDGLAGGGGVGCLRQFRFFYGGDGETHRSFLVLDVGCVVTGSF